MRVACTVVCAMALAASTALAGDLKSGLQVGEALPAFTVEKCSGAVNDGKATGDSFCYRCMLGNKPVVMVFSRKADESLVKLTKELDAACAKNADKKLSSFVSLLGKDADATKAKAKEFGTKHKLQHVAIVVPEENENGPAEYNIAAAAETTVIIYREGKVVANHAVAAGKLDAKKIAAIVADTSKILN